MNRAFFAGKNVLVMGLGRFGGGGDVVRFARGAGSKVTVTDLALPESLAEPLSRLADLEGIEYHLGGHDRADFDRADIVVVNPAVRPDHELIDIARGRGGIITTRINIFFEICFTMPARPRIVGITGSNGKSTTSALTACLLKAGTERVPRPPYGNVILSGNIGNSPLLCDLEHMGPADIVVLELSSFQTERLADIRKGPDIALLTNLTPNHLDRHATFAAYCRAKENLFSFQPLNAVRPAVSIFNAEDEVARRWFDKYSADLGRVCVKFSHKEITPELGRHFALPGGANLSNLAGALAVVENFGITRRDAMGWLPAFKGLPHRLEMVAEHNGIAWYNDSIATTPQSTIAALEAFERPKVLIAGGYDKQVPFDRLGDAIGRLAKATILIGATSGKIADSIRSQHPKAVIRTANSLAQAVELARSLARPGDVVLLSPACASYDMFENFQQRGQQFAALVKGIDD